MMFESGSIFHVQLNMQRSSRVSRHINLHVAGSFSRGIDEDFSASKPPLESRQVQTISVCKLGKCLDGAVGPIWLESVRIECWGGDHSGRLKLHQHIWKCQTTWPRKFSALHKYKTHDFSDADPP